MNPDAKNATMTVLGLMSGTSVDGVDACLVRLWMENPDGSEGTIDSADAQFRHQILATYSAAMPSGLRERLLKAMADKHLALAELCALNIAVGELFAQTALALLKEHHIPASSVDCIGSHGQTIFHWPPTQAGKLGGTLQIGEPALIAEMTGILTIADFRPGDMAAGGQGAPLVCFADHLLFADATRWRFVQNIGGIANVTVVPPLCSDQPMLAFDTGPGNMLMDAAMSYFYSHPYDENGDTAASGKIHSNLLSTLLAHPYLQMAPPKTTGREDFGEAYFQQELLPRFPDIPACDWLTTLAHFTAISIADAYQQWIFPTSQIKEIPAETPELIIGGGGARNRFLLQSLQDAFQGRGLAVQIKTHASYGIPDQYKEALAFAILAWAARLGMPNNIPSCTGASRPVILGKQVPVSTRS